MQRFYLGIHQPAWLDRVDVPVFISHRALDRQKSWKRASAPWALDSGGFSELRMFGGWVTTPAAYVRSIARYAEEIGRLEWAAPQDWMVEPTMLARTGLTIAEHQHRTVANYVELRDMTEGFVIPVLQGWTLADYMRCVDLYDKAGVDLTAERRVGLGSVCRREATGQIGEIVAAMSLLGLRLHGFGVKRSGIERYGWMLDSADSMAWSYGGRLAGPCPESPRRKGCANCLHYALAWRTSVVAPAMAAPVQLAMAH